MKNSIEFYEKSEKKQLEIISLRITKAAKTGDPVIMLPFDTYPDVEDKLLRAGWYYKYYYFDNRRCALFFPEQFVIGYKDSGEQRESCNVMDSRKFYEITLEKQRECIDIAIRKAEETGDPYVRLSFDVYPVIEDEINSAGYVYEKFVNAEGKTCACFFPRQYQYES